MRIERIEASKHKRGRVLVFLEDGACLKITEQELLDFGLRAGDELEADTLGRLKDAAGVSNTKASAAELIELIQMVEHHAIPAIFTETNGATAAASVIGAETGCAVYALDMAMSGSSYFEAMYHNIDTIKEALG
jgi:regulatory protein